MDSSENQLTALKIFIIGNIGGGKTTLSRELAKKHSLPVFHVDQIQFLSDLSIRPLAETRGKLREIMSQGSWIIDGYGPLDLLEDRLRLADQIVLLDLPYWQHVLWLLKRLLLEKPREELPPNATEWKWSHLKKIFRSQYKMQFEMRPQILKMLNKSEYREKVTILRSRSEVVNAGNQLSTSFFDAKKVKF